MRWEVHSPHSGCVRWECRKTLVLSVPCVGGWGTWVLSHFPASFRGEKAFQSTSPVQHLHLQIPGWQWDRNFVTCRPLSSKYGADLQIQLSIPWGQGRGLRNASWGTFVTVWVWRSALQEAEASPRNVTTRHGEQKTGGCCPVSHTLLHGGLCFYSK